MLNQMLQLLQDGGIHSTAELARRLGASEGLVTAMAADLARRGYLAPVEPGCSTKCDGCGAAAACTTPLRVTMLTLTAKGRMLARHSSPGY